MTNKPVKKPKIPSSSKLLLLFLFFFCIRRKINNLILAIHDKLFLWLQSEKLRQYNVLVNWYVENKYNPRAHMDLGGPLISNYSIHTIIRIM
jgi:hypothetical protein